METERVIGARTAALLPSSVLLDNPRVSAYHIWCACTDLLAPSGPEAAHGCWDRSCGAQARVRLTRILTPPELCLLVNAGVC